MSHGIRTFQGDLCLGGRRVHHRFRAEESCLSAIPQQFRAAGLLYDVGDAAGLGIDRNAEEAVLQRRGEACARGRLGVARPVRTNGVHAEAQRGRGGLEADDRSMGIALLAPSENDSRPLALAVVDQQPAFIRRRNPAPYLALTVPVAGVVDEDLLGGFRAGVRLAAHQLRQCPVEGVPRGLENIGLPLLRGGLRGNGRPRAAIIGDERFLEAAHVIALGVVRTAAAVGEMILG